MQGRPPQAEACATSVCSLRQISASVSLIFSMPSDDVIRAETKAQGLRIKRNNLLAAALSGAVLAGVSLWFFPHSIPGILGGFVLGFFYANGFEYCLHRFILHGSRGFFRQEHIVHHATLNSPEMRRGTSTFPAIPGEWWRFSSPMPRRFCFCSGFSAMAGPRECSPASRFTTSRLKKFTGACTWAAGCRNGCVRPRGTTCCIMRTTPAASMFSFRYLTGLRSGSSCSARIHSDEPGR